MTTEEKAKAYDEALEKAKAHISNKGIGDTVDLCKHIFPELAESEDERVVKEIIHYILYKANGVSEKQEHEWIAYLEKQKELDKMIVVSPEVWDNAISDAYKNGKKDGEKQKEPHYADKRVDDIMNMPELSAFEQALTNFIGYWEDDEEHWPSQFVKKHGKHILDMAREELQKEQKPVDYDHEMWKNCEANFEGGKKEVIEHPEKYGLQKEQKSDTRDTDDLQLLGFIYDLLNEIEWKDNWAMSKDECLRRLNNYRPQKPVEKQDYSGLNDLERAILRGFLAAGIENVPVGIIKDTVSECVGFLALIKTEPAEWSDEDKFPKDIEKDATQFCFDNGINITPHQAKQIATHYLMVGHNEGYIEGRKNAHIPARELGLPSSCDFQKEQKPVSYSPLCNTIKDKIREYVTNHFVTDTVVKTDVKSIVKAMEEGVRLGKEEQKPVEWSEEDEAAYDAFTCEVVNEKMNPTTEQVKWLRSIRDRLKSLRPSKK